MAEQPAQERSERATPKRIEDARKRGEVPRSPELSAAAVTLTAGAGLYFMGAGLGGDLASLMRASLSIDAGSAPDSGVLATVLGGALREALMAALPLLGLIMCAALAAPLAIGGWSPSIESLGFKSERLNPFNGLRRIASLRGIVELGKALAKFLLVATVAASVIASQADDLLTLGREPLAGAISDALKLCAQALLAMAASLVVIAAVDVPYQLWQYQRQLRMSREELREEIKESDGSPETRSRIRSIQRAMAGRRMMADVPTADVVITNPTHYAVALKYAEDRMRAPVVVAKGAGSLAARIRELAVEHGVPLFEAPPLARALYRHVEIGIEIPAALYVAVAQVLTYVYEIRAARRVGAPPPLKPQIDPGVESLGAQVMS